MLTRNIKAVTVLAHAEGDWGFGLGCPLPIQKNISKLIQCHILEGRSLSAECQALQATGQIRVVQALVETGFNGAMGFWLGCPLPIQWNINIV